MFQPILVRPTRSFAIAAFFRQRDMAPIHLLPPLPFILRHIHRNPVKIRAHQSFAAKARQSPKQPQKYVLCQVVNVVVAPRKPRERPKDHLLMVADNLLEVRLAL
jgi:hypothetical protein